jgi:hypothetical protein
VHTRVVVVQGVHSVSTTHVKFMTAYYDFCKVNCRNEARCQGPVEVDFDGKDTDVK